MASRLDHDISASGLIMPTQGSTTARLAFEAPVRKARISARRPTILVAAFLSALAAVAISGCGSEDGPTNSTGVALESETNDNPPAAELALPEREGPRRETTSTVPHIQIDAEPDPDVDAELRRRVFQLPGVQDLPSDRSLPGARGLAISADLDLARPDVIDGSREFAHIHPDGSLHVWLPVDLALEVHEKKWGEMHPWVERDGFWDGVVMVYTPETFEELDVTIRIVVEAYNFVTGASLTP